MYKKALSYILTFVFMHLISFSFAQKDSLLLPYVDFFNLVSKNHPVAKLANLELDYAAADLMMARGGFDPKLTSYFDRKSISDVVYYNHWVSQLKVPVWGGIDFVVEREQNNGNRLSPELSSNATFTGISVPLGNGLIIEQRRATLMQSKIYQKMAVAEQQKMANKLIFSAAKDYWEWYLSYQNMRLQQEGYQLALDRFVLIKSQASVGELAPIDSVEAKITLQTREVAYKSARVDFKNQSLLLSNYLWTEAEQPLEIPDNMFPPSIPSYLITQETLDGLVEQARANHPEITKLNFKQDQLFVDRRLAMERFKPNLDLKLGYLDTPKDRIGDYPLLSTNHKVGIDFSFPLYLRKERGKLEQVKIKQIQIDLERRQLSREIINDVYAFYNEVRTFEQLINIQKEASELQEQLLRAEKSKFDIGESSLFLINSRENKLIEIKLKMEELKSKYEKSIASMVYAAGLQRIN